MSGIKGISSSLLLCYVKMQANMTQDPKEVADSLAKDEKISKEKLASMIEALSSSDLDEASKEQMMALIALEKNWDEVSDGKDSISLDTIKKFMAQYAKSTTSTLANTESEKSGLDQINSDLTNSGSDISTDSEGYTSVLNSLLSGNTDKNDDVNAEKIATLINKIADQKNTSSVSVEA